MVNDCLFISSRYHYFIISSYVLSLTGCVVGVYGVDVLEIVAYSWCRRPCILSWCVCMVKKRQTNKLETLMRVACEEELKHEHLLEVVLTNFAYLQSTYSMQKVINFFLLNSSVFSKHSDY